MLACTSVFVHAQDSVQTVVERDAPLKILEKPRAAYPTSEGGSICVQGSVRLKVQFLSTGEIGAITPVTRLPFGLTENAVAAEKKIKFVPAMKDGMPVTKTSTVDYSFTIY